MRKRYRTGLLAGLLAGLLMVLPSTVVAETDELWQYRNLGKAFYENPTTQFQAVEMFRKALEVNPGSPQERLNYGLSLIRAGKSDEGVAEISTVQKEAPEIPHTWFNLGIYYKKQAQYEEARRQFEEMVRLVPDEPISHYNLGVVLKLTGENDRALQHFERAAELDPNLAGPYFQIYNAFRAAGRTEEADRAFKKFQENKRLQAGAAVPEDLDWSYYAEILDEVEPTEAADPKPEEFANNLAFEVNRLAMPSSGPGAGLLSIDLKGEGQVDLLVWNEKSVVVYPGFSGEPSEIYRTGQGTLSFVQASDFNNDGLTDLALGLGAHVLLLGNNAGTFEEVASLESGEVRSALWLDFDHDSDLDLFLLGGRSILFRNNGGSGFGPATEMFPFVDGEAVAGAAFELVKDTNSMDLLVLYRDRAPVLYRDRLAGNFEALDLPGLPGNADQVWARDLNNDGWTDLLAQTDAGPRFFLNRSGRLEASDPGVGAAGALAVADFGNRGYLDLLVDSRVYQGLGVGRVAPAKELASLKGSRELLAQDFDADGWIDLAAVDSSGGVLTLNNRFGQPALWFSVSLTGVRNPRLAAGSEVEVKAASLYQKQVYQGLPLHFGLGRHEKIDTVRITWANGLIQNEPEQLSGQASNYKEKQRLSGSCPMVFAWNGREFEFITDVLAVAPLGAAAGDGIFFNVDHDEYIQIPSRSLAPNAEGLYEVRITEELREIGYLDKIKLIAVDRPRELAVFTSEKFKSPPFPEFRLYGVENRQYPVQARDHRGRDVLESILRRDRKYPSTFQRDYLGVAEEHFLELNFGKSSHPGEDSILVLSGWVDWADGSTIRKLAQDESTGLVMPYLQVQDSHGEWKTVVEDMGVPAGKPKTIVVDLSGLFPTADRNVRIVTNLCVYWDEVFLSADTELPSVGLQELALVGAELAFRGFSTPIVHPDRLQPEAFDYSRWMPVSMWNPADGLYTRYGPVDPLLRTIDDQFVIMGSGDELRLRFSEGKLAPVPEGHVRDFILFVDGWAKDGDLNTAFSQTVEPLPFHDMSAYPYPDTESYPETEYHRIYRETYNTRPALRFIRSLADTRTARDSAEE